jgi:hypothetical protein
MLIEEILKPKVGALQNLRKNQTSSKDINVFLN